MSASRRRRQRVDHRDADAVEAAGHLIGALLELAAGMQHRHHHVDGRHSGLVHRHRDPSAVVGDLDTAVLQHANVDLVGVTSHRLVDGVVDDLPDQVVQSALAGGADVHTGALPDRLQTLENLDGVGTVCVVLFRFFGAATVGRVSSGLAGGRPATARDIVVQSTGNGGQDRFCGGVSAHLIAPCGAFLESGRVRTAETLVACRSGVAETRQENRCRRLRPRGGVRARRSDTLGGMKKMSRGIALAVCVAALVLPAALASCSSSSTATTANAEVGQAGGPVRVGVAEFATLTGSRKSR